MVRIKRKRFMLGHEDVGTFVSENRYRLIELFHPRRVSRWGMNGYITEDAWSEIIGAHLSTERELCELHQVKRGPQAVLTLLIVRKGQEAIGHLAETLDVQPSTVRNWRSSNRIPEYLRMRVAKVLRTEFDIPAAAGDLEDQHG